MGKLEGKVALITGGNSGIGLATAEHFASEGAYVFITGRRQTELDEAVKKIGRNITALRADVAIAEDLDRVYAAIKLAKGHLDVLFANAGVAESAACDWPLRSVETGARVRQKVSRVGSPRSSRAIPASARTSPPPASAGGLELFELLSEHPRQGRRQSQPFELRRSRGRNRRCGR
jgi:NAD(P)-dependent dehydrogenase (short-subunit alcohol dehydrogenase family)